MFMATVKHALPVRSIPLNLISARILYMDAGERIKQVRKRLDLTQEAFGKLAGVSKAAVSQWESGRTKPERDALLSLKRKRGISPEWITSGKGEMFDTTETGTDVTELNAAWGLLLDGERDELLELIKERAKHNKAVLDQHALPEVKKRTVSVSERRLQQANIPFAERRIKHAKQDKN